MAFLGLPRHCTYQLDRTGKRRVRFRCRGVAVYLTGIPWSEEFMRQYIRKANKARLARQARELVRADREQNYPTTEPKFTQQRKSDG